MAAGREGGGRDLNWAVRLVVGGREPTGQETEKSTSYFGGRAILTNGARGGTGWAHFFLRLKSGLNL